MEIHEVEQRLGKAYQKEGASKFVASHARHAQSGEQTLQLRQVYFTVSLRFQVLVALGLVQPQVD